MIKIKKNGFTLLETLIATTLSCVLIIGILRLYLSSAKSYNTQDLTTEMCQNTNYTCKRLSEEIIQAGVYLPDSNYNVITVNSSKTDSFCIRANPTGAYYEFIDSTANTNIIYVDSALGFRGISDIVKLDTSGNLATFTINTSYNTAPFQQGVNTDSIPNQICITANASFLPGDIIFASQKRLLFKNGTNFCINTADNVLAENIDSLSIQFYDASKNMTSSWIEMKYAKIFVQCRTSIPDPQYTHPVNNDHYRRYSQSMDVLIRKKATF